MKASSLLTPVEARQEYFHYLREPYTKYIGYMEWKKLYQIEVESTPRVKKLIEITGYPGHSEIDDVYEFVDDELELIGKRISDVRRILVDVINMNHAFTLAAYADIYSVLSNTIDTITGILSTIELTILETITKVATWLEDTLDTWIYIIEQVIDDTSQWIRDVALQITREVDAALIVIGNYIGDMYTQFSEAVDAIATRTTGRFEIIGNIIIAGINGAVGLAVTIVESLGGIITTMIESTERLLSGLIDNIVKTVDLLVTGIKDIIGGTINTLLDFLKWLWGEVTALLDKMFDFDVENLSTLFVALAEAQKKAFLLLKERAETVQP